VFIGAQRRHRETWEGINTALQYAPDPGMLPGFNEFDFGGLLNARYRGKERPETLHTDRGCISRRCAKPFWNGNAARSSTRLNRLKPLPPACATRGRRPWRGTPNR
jgi:hypothetical protein